VKNYLKKVFKHLKLRKNPETKAYTRDPEIHTEPLKPKITELWYQGVDSSDSGSDDEGDKKKSMEEEENLKVIEQEKEANLVSMEEARKALMHGLQSLPEPEKPQEEEAAEQPNRIKGEEWRSMLDEQFGSLNEDKGYSKLGKSRDFNGGLAF